ncbi:MAG: hypothetical protein M3Z05_13130 [Gemmatimonadota bacterium]|nr:hypothetical protein [Gemmatimonadota bacterium]
MESQPPIQTTTLASILETEKVMQPARARALLASLAQATTLPPDPASPAGWTHQIRVVSTFNGVERATFRDESGAPRPAGDRAAHVVRLVDALRAAAIAMLWGVDGMHVSADRRAAPEGQARLPRLHQLLVEQWAATRNTCDSADKFMMFFEATLALDRAAEPKVGREAFKTLSLQALDARKKHVKVGTLGVPFAAIIDTGKFQKAVRPVPAGAAPADAQSALSPMQAAAACAPSPVAAPLSGAPSLFQRFGVPILIVSVLAVVIAVIVLRH